VPGPERAAAGLDDVGRRIEVRLADLEVDDVAALRLETLRLRQHRERRLGPRRSIRPASLTRMPPFVLVPSRLFITPQAAARFSGPSPG
jgi:hypothetical protein